MRGLFDKYFGMPFTGILNINNKPTLGLSIALHKRSRGNPKIGRKVCCSKKQHVNKSRHIRYGP